MSKKKDCLVVEYSGKEIMEKLELLHELQEKTYQQACATNGRVTKLEKKSFGLWVSNHPVQFTIYTIIMMGILISDIRHPIIDLLLKFV